MASCITISLSCLSLLLVLLTTLQTDSAFGKPSGELTTSAHQHSIPKAKGDTNIVQTSNTRLLPSGHNAEGNFKLNAASQDAGKRGPKVQKVDEEFVTKEKLTRILKGDVASKHEFHTTGLRRPPSGPNPEGNFEVNAASQDVGKRGAKVQHVEKLPESTQD